MKRKQSISLPSNIVLNAKVLCHAIRKLETEKVRNIVEQLIDELDARDTECDLEFDVGFELPDHSGVSTGSGNQSELHGHGNIPKQAIENASWWVVE